MPCSLTPSFLQDADGKITTNDLKHYWRKFKSIMKTKLPSAGGFSFGFVLGAKHG
jgi:uncharacterized membrane protein (Fun14 family)